MAALTSDLKVSALKCSMSTEKSLRLQSHRIGFSPNCITGYRSVSQDTAGTITLSPGLISPASIKAANIIKLAEDPELTKVECLTPSQSLHLDS